MPILPTDINQTLFQTSTPYIMVIISRKHPNTTEWMRTNDNECGSHWVVRAVEGVSAHAYITEKRVHGWTELLRVGIIETLQESVLR